jgi:Condensation domain
MQRFHERQNPVFGISDASSWSLATLREEIDRESHRPFDLESGPVIYIHLYVKSVNETIVLIKVHHLAIDLWSLSILMEEFQVLYLTRQFGAGLPLPLPHAHYKDFLRFEERAIQSSEGEPTREYWRKQLTGSVTRLDLPSDRPRSATPTYRGSTAPIRLDAELTRAVRLLAKEEKTTVFSTLLAAFQGWLGRLSDSEDVMIATKVAGRSRLEFERVVGCFANTISLRADLSGNPSFRTILRRVRQVVQDALAHQDNPFPHHQLTSSPPVCNVLFVLQKPNLFASGQKWGEDVDSFGISSQSEVGARLGLGDESIEIYPVELQVARLDLELEMVETKDELRGWMRYSLDLFDHDTVVNFLESFDALLREIVADPDQRIADLTVVRLTRV